MRGTIDSRRRPKAAAERGRLRLAVAGLLSAVGACVLLCADPDDGSAPVSLVAPPSSLAADLPERAQLMVPRTVPRLAEPSAIEIRPSVEPGGLRPPQHTAQRKAPPDPKVLEGMVRDPQGRPLADYPVTIIHDASPGTDSPGPAWSTRTRGDGMFVVQLPAP